MEFQIAEAVELVQTLAETENLTLTDAFRTFVAEAGLDIEYASQLKGALFEEYTLGAMASDSLTNALYKVFVSGEAAEEVVESETKETQEGTKYKVRVKDRSSGSSYIRYATREKIAELRANPNISSVEMTDHGSAGEDDRGERTAAAKGGGGGRDFDGDGKKESSSKEHAGVVHNAIQRKMGGTPDGNDTRKEEFEVEEGIDFKGARREDDRRKKEQDEKDKKSPSSKDRRLAMGKFRPGASKEERAEGGRDVMREKGTSPTKNGKKMFEEYLAARQEITEARAKTKEEARKKLEAHRAAMKDGGKSPYFGDTEKKEEGGKDPWSTHPSDAKAHRKEDQQEGYKGKHGQSDEEHMDSRSDNAKQISGDSKHSGAAYSHRSYKGVGKPAKPGERQEHQGKMTQADRDELKIRKAALKKKTQKEEVFLEADLVDAGRKNQNQRDKKKVDGKGVDNSTNVKLMPSIGEEVVTENGMTASQKRLSASAVNEALRTKIQDFRAGLQEECCPNCGTPECTCEGKKEEKPKRKKKAKLDESGMPIFETKAESRNNARPGPEKEDIDPPADPLGAPGHMNPKGKPKRPKGGDRRPNAGGPDLPNEKGTVPNGAGV